MKPGLGLWATCDEGDHKWVVGVGPNWKRGYLCVRCASFVAFTRAAAQPPQRSDSTYIPSGPVRVDGEAS